MYTKNIVNRFLEKQESDIKTGCILWTAGKCGDGYGSFYTTKNAKAHRVAWEIKHKQQIPKGMVVRHSCDTPLCVNPDHLSIGTHADNHKDMDARGRRASIKGEKNFSAKLTKEKADVIRELNELGISYSKLSVLSGVSKSTIAKIVNKEIWN